MSTNVCPDFSEFCPPCCQYQQVEEVCETLCGLMACHQMCCLYLVVFQIKIPTTARTNQQQSEVQRESEAWGEPTSGWHSVPPCTSWPVDPSSRLWGSCCNGCSPICNETLPHLSERSHSCNPHWRNEVPRAAGQHIITHSQQLIWQVMTDQFHVFMAQAWCLSWLQDVSFRHADSDCLLKVVTNASMYDTVLYWPNNIFKKIYILML